MNAANYAIFIALEKVLALNHVEVNMLYKNFFFINFDFNIVKINIRVYKYI